MYIVYIYIYIYIRLKIKLFNQTVLELDSNLHIIDGDVMTEVNFCCVLCVIKKILIVVSKKLCIHV
jgi:hypothetical protein